MDKIEELKKLVTRLKEGAVSEEEFKYLKSLVISDSDSTHRADVTSVEPKEDNLTFKKKPSKRKWKIFLLSILAFITIIIASLFYIIKGEDNAIKRKIQNFSTEFNQFVGQIDKIKDIEGNEYKTILIGEQTWMAENLNTSTFCNGDPIPEAKTSEEWDRGWYDQKAVWCYYENNQENGRKYGKLYNWWAVIDPRGLAPEGWHVSSNSEWSNLLNFLGGGQDAIAKLIATKDWKDKEGANTSGFTALPAGIQDCGSNDGRRSYALGELGCFWTSDSYDEYRAYWVFIGGTEIKKWTKGKGSSVRCIKDIENSSQNDSRPKIRWSKQETGVVYEDNERIGKLIKRECVFTGSKNGFDLDIPAGKMWTPIYFEYDNKNNCSNLYIPKIYTERGNGTMWFKNSSYHFPEKDDFVSYKISKRNNRALTGDKAIMTDGYCESIKFVFYFIEE